MKPVDGAREALDRLRAAGIRLGVVTNQSGIARGLITPAELDAVLDRLQELLGPFDTVQHCPHDDADACECRKPRPGMVTAAAANLGVDAADCVVVGDTGADMAAARAAGARAVLVPLPVTLAEQVDAAPACADDITHAVDLILEGRI